MADSRVHAQRAKTFAAMAQAEYSRIVAALSGTPNRGGGHRVCVLLRRLMGIGDGYLERARENKLFTSDQRVVQAIGVAEKWGSEANRRIGAKCSRC